MSDREGHAKARPTLAILAVLGLVALPFVPLLLAVIEDATLDTNYVESVCRGLGVHAALGRLYEMFGIR